jgi:hypothetical protein
MTVSKGSMLIVALGILTLLSILAITFVSLMKLERKASANYVEGVKARLIAEAGISRTVSEMKNMIVRNPYSDHWKYEYNARLGESSPWIDIQISRNPSLKDRRQSTGIRGFSGYLGSSYTGGKDTYTLKIVDTADQININGQQDAIAMILDHLGRAISMIPRPGRGRVSDPVRIVRYGTNRGGAAIIAYRNTLDGQRFSSKYQLLELYQNNEQHFNNLKDFITTRSWIDPNSVRPKYTNPLTRPPDVMREPRSPVCVNTAPKEVFMAVIAGLAGHAVFCYPTEINRQQMEAGTEFATQYGANEQEELKYKVQPAIINIGPFDIRQAMHIADAIISYRRSRRGFRSFADFNYFIDHFVRRNQAMLPRWNDPRIPADIRNRKEFPKFFLDAAADILKSNFNPEACVSYFNPNTALARHVDKGGLWLMSRNTPNVANPWPRDELRHTTDFCLTTRGYFEVTSLGEIWKTSPRQPQDKPQAQEKIRTIVKIMDCVSHSTQRDFERWDRDYYAYRRRVQTHPENKIFWDYDRPDNTGGAKIARDCALSNDRYGYLEIEPQCRRGGVNTDYQSILGPKLFEALYEFRRRDRWGKVLLQNFYHADCANRRYWRPPPPLNNFGVANGTAPTYANYITSTESNFGQLYPDGVYCGVRRNWRKSYFKTLWYRAACDVHQYRRTYNISRRWRDSDLQGESIENLGNMRFTRGACEFWYKPDFDWAQRDMHDNIIRDSTGEKATELFCGLLFASQVRRNKLAPTQNGVLPFTTGTQLLVARNTLGYLRITRLYFEVVGEKGHDRPWVEDPKNPGTFIDIETYRQKNSENDQDYPWPPKEIKVDPHVKYARADAFVPFQQMKNWRRNEWHHIAIFWDDGQTDARNIIKVYLDGVKASGTCHPLPATPGEQLFVRLNEPATLTPGTAENLRRPKDHVYVGCIERMQAKTGGIFKFAERDPDLGRPLIQQPANGTIDDVRFYQGPPGVPSDGAFARRLPERFFDYGTYRNRFDMRDKFSAGVQELELAALSWETYLPTMHGTTSGLYKNYYGRGGMIVVPYINTDRRPLRPPYYYRSIRQNNFIPLMDPRTGGPIRLKTTDRFFYDLQLRAAYFDPRGLSVDTPIVDSVTLYYFLPREEYVLKERIFD